MYVRDTRIVVLQYKDYKSNNSALTFLYEYSHIQTKRGKILQT
jgi:hypothetical protein